MQCRAWPHASRPLQGLLRRTRTDTGIETNLLLRAWRHRAQVEGEGLAGQRRSCRAARAGNPREGQGAGEGVTQLIAAQRQAAVVGVLQAVFQVIARLAAARSADSVGYGALISGPTFRGNLTTSAYTVCAAASAWACTLPSAKSLAASTCTRLSGAVRPTIPCLYDLAECGTFHSIERVTQITDALFGASISDGTVALNVNLASERLKTFEDDLKAGLRQQAVLHANETGIKVGGKLNWFHVACSAKGTLYTLHEKRSYAAIEAVLTDFTGIVVHDAWNTYFRLSGEHALSS